MLLKVSLLSEELKQRQRLLEQETDRCRRDRAKVTETAAELGKIMTQLKGEWDTLKQNKQELHEKR